MWTGSQLPPVNLAMLALAAPYTSFTTVPADQLLSHDHRGHDEQCAVVRTTSKWWDINNRDDTCRCWTVCSPACTVGSTTR